MADLNINHLSEAWQKRILSEDIKKHFLTELDFFMDKSVMVENHILMQFSSIIFEGAQGLLLDESKGVFPYVTRSTTGLKNCLEIAKSIGLSKLDVFYITRAYLTRHGSGPLPFELDYLPYPNIIDETNIANFYQGSMRFSWLNLDLMQQAINSDLNDSQDKFIIAPHLVVTCMDQLDLEVKLIKHNQLITLSKTHLIKEIQKYFPTFSFWSSNGPTRTTIEKH